MKSNAITIDSILADIPNNKGVLATLLVATVLVIGLLVGLSQLENDSIGQIALTEEKIERMRAFHNESKRRALFGRPDGTVTRDGIRGKLSFDRQSGELVMELTDRDGAPVNDAHVIAQVSTPYNAFSDPQKMLLRQTSGARYSANLDTNDSDTVIVSITASDTDPSAYTSFLFHIEKTFRRNELRLH